MVFPRWSASASQSRKAWPGPAFASVILAATLGAVAPAPAEPRKAAHGAAEFDTAHMFGFTEGSDIGAVGEKELETDSIGRSAGRRAPTAMSQRPSRPSTPSANTSAFRPRQRFRATTL